MCRYVSLGRILSVSSKPNSKKREREREKAKVWNKKPRNKHFVRAD